MKNTDNTLQDLLDKSFTEFNLVQGSLIKANVVEVGKKMGNFRHWFQIRWPCLN